MTDRENQLKEALAIAIEYIEEVLGSDAEDSETLQYLYEIAGMDVSKTEE